MTAISVVAISRSLREKRNGSQKARRTSVCNEMELASSAILQNEKPLGDWTNLATGF